MNGDATELEKVMLEKGFASTRMVAAKLKRTQKNVWYLISTGKLRCQEVNQQKFVEIASVLEYSGPMGVKALNLGDWSDAV